MLLEFDNSTQEHYIERSNGVADDVEKVVVISNQHALQNFSILVLDWEEDGALGNLSIPVRIHHPVGMFSGLYIAITVHSCMQSNQ